MISNIQAQKDLLRSQARARRAAVTPASGLEAAGQIAAHFQATFKLAKGAIVAGYWPMDNEADVRPLLETLHGQGCRLCLPAVIEASKPLVFREWAPGEPLVGGAHGTRHPQETAQSLIPQVVLAPLLAYDARGWRLGFGAGYYDRTLQNLRRSNEIIAVGVGYGCQEFPDIPHEETDQRLDAIVTEKGVIRTA